jgi:hypothetical protein
MGIYIAAVITTLAVVAAYGYLIRRLSPSSDHRFLLIAGMMALPLQPLAFYLVRLPLDGLVRQAIGTGAAYGWVTTFYAPLTEEPAKWLVLAVPLVWRALRPDNAVAAALAVGLGFGIGEIWFLAEQIARVPAYQAVPFWMFGGFLTERFIVCFLHGGFIAFLVARLASGHALLPGALAGLALHYFGNLPIFLASIEAFGLPAAAWITIASLVPLLMAILLGMALGRMTGGRLQKVALGESTCPECGNVYPRPFAALNFGLVRYERCPKCRHFHMIRLIGAARPMGDKSGQA